MKQRVTMATLTIGICVGIAGISGCASDGTSEGRTSNETTATATTPTPPAITTEAPPVDNEDPAAVALRGDWQIPAEKYVLHLIEDGTFIEDFQGVQDFRTGKYKVDGKTLSLVGDDGNTDKAKITGDTLVFKLGTATRVQ